MGNLDNSDEVIMHIHNIFRFSDPIFRLTTVGAIRLLQFFARMAKEKKLAHMEIEDFGKFLKVTEGKYDIMNIPAVDKEQLSKELREMGVHYTVMPDLDKNDGLMQVAVYQPDREKFAAWYERYLIDRMQGGEKGSKELRGLTKGNVSIVSFPLEGREEGMEDDFRSLGINYARLPDLRVGDGSIQMEIANSDMGKVNQWYKLKQKDMLHTGNPLPPMETITMEQYSQTGKMSEEDYMDTATEDMKRASRKYEKRGRGEAERLLRRKEGVIKEGGSSSFIDHVKDPDYVPVTINRASLVENSVVTEEMRERLIRAGCFCCRIPGTWEKGEDKEEILIVPLKDVYEVDDGKTYVAFLDKNKPVMVLQAGNGAPVAKYAGVTAEAFAKSVFRGPDPEKLKAEKTTARAKSLAETLSARLKQPAPPVMVK